MWEHKNNFHLFSFPYCARKINLLYLYHQKQRIMNIIETAKAAIAKVRQDVILAILGSNAMTFEGMVELVAEIFGIYPDMTDEKFAMLIHATEVGGVSFVSIANYTSDLTQGTESANHVINVGASYQNMKDKDVDIFANFDLSQVDVNRYNYANCALEGILVPNENYDENSIAHRKTIPNPDYQEGVKGSRKTMENPAYDPESQAHKENIRIAFASVEELKEAVRNALPAALKELQAGPKRKVTNYYVYFNKVLAYNTNTKRFSVKGQAVTKTITEQGEYKVVAKAPMTIAKDLIEKQAKGRTQTLRRFTLDNMQTMRVQGETLHIG